MIFFAIRGFGMGGRVFHRTPSALHFLPYSHEHSSRIVHEMLFDIQKLVLCENERTFNTVRKHNEEVSDVLWSLRSFSGVSVAVRV